MSTASGLRLRPHRGPVCCGGRHGSDSGGTVVLALICALELSSDADLAELGQTMFRTPQAVTASESELQRQPEARRERQSSGGWSFKAVPGPSKTSQVAQGASRDLPKDSQALSEGFRGLRRSSQDCPRVPERLQKVSNGLPTPPTGFQRLSETLPRFPMGCQEFQPVATGG